MNNYLKNMASLFNKFDIYIRKQNIIVIILILLLLSYILSLPALFLSYIFPNIFNNLSGPKFVDDSFVFIFFVVCIVAPLAETLVFQWLPARIMGKFKQVSNLQIILISSIIFGLYHAYSPYYIVFATGLGVIFIYGFIILDGSKNSAYWCVALLHSLRNLIAYIMFVSIN